MPRKYQMKRRAERVEDTRRRIVEAAIDLHQTIGPARTSLSAIARRAGVERQTLYRHFPDERAVGVTCSGLYMERNPLPDVESWRRIEGSEERLRHGLEELYRYYEDNEPMFTNIVRDAEIDPLTRELGNERLMAMKDLRAAIAEGFGAARRKVAVRAAVDLAVGFQTWRSLTRESGLSRRAAVDLMCSMVLCVAHGGR